MLHLISMKGDQLPDISQFNSDKSYRVRLDEVVFSNFSAGSSSFTASYVNNQSIHIEAFPGQISGYIEFRWTLFKQGRFSEQARDTGRAVLNFNFEA